MLNFLLNLAVIVKDKASELDAKVAHAAAVIESRPPREIKPINVKPYKVDIIEECRRWRK